MSTMADQTRDIKEIDSNFKAATVGDLAVNYYNALEAPFAVEGFAWRAPGGALYRLPESFTNREINDGALYLAHNTAGGAIRFRSDSPYIVLRSKLAYSGDMNHMPRTGSAGFEFSVARKFTVSAVRFFSSFHLRSARETRAVRS